MVFTELNRITYYTFHISLIFYGTLWRSQCAIRSQQFRKENVVTLCFLYAIENWISYCHASPSTEPPHSDSGCMPNECWSLFFVFFSKEAIMSKIWGFAYRFIACVRSVCACVCVWVCMYRAFVCEQTRFYVWMILCGMCHTLKSNFICKMHMK